MPAIFTLPFFLVSTILDMLARKRGDDAAAGIFQPLTTLIVVVAALLSLFSGGAKPSYTFGISLGLVISMGADMILIDRKDPVAFIKGMLLFFAVLIVYSATFIAEAGFHVRDLFAVPLLAVYYCVFVAVLWKGLGKLKIPVMVYGLAFVFCVSRAFATFFAPGFSTVQSILVLAGTTLFMLGDSQLAIYHFANPKFPMFWAPAFYFVGQYLLAISVSLF
jgi:uncharacterized membrane protein YhhN